MLNKIYIKNYILIDELELDFSKGLNIITGETGAGKSILINAIDIAFGAKIGKEVIKNGAEKAVIELTIQNTKQDLSKLFEEYGIDNEPEILLSREITQTGSRSRINGCLVNQDFLKQFREYLLDIHSQHQTYSFLQPKFHINLLDEYIKSEKLNIYTNKYENYQAKLKELENLKNASQKTSDQIEFLKFQVNEIQEANLNSINEDEELNNELSVLENVEKLKDLTGSSFWALNGDNNSILETLSQIKTNISKAFALDNTLQDTESELISGIETLKEVSSSLRDYSSTLNNDTERINAIQERLFLLEKLKRKYGGSIEAVMNFENSLEQELANIEFSTQNIEDLQQELEQTKSELLVLAKEISEERKKYGQILSEEIVKKLEKLELPKVRFEIGISETELGTKGIDSVEFLISTNISENLKPLAKVASGGEISRVMLAIKTIFAETDNIETVVFDEIDTGVSGKTSQAMAEEIKELSKYMQIIMITHQAIIASKSDKHFYIKKTQNDTTSVNIYVLAGENKIKGIAELAGGRITDETMEFAKNLLQF